VKQSVANPPAARAAAPLFAASVAATMAQQTDSTPSAPRRQSRVVKVLAVIGAIFVAMMMIGMCSTPNRNCFIDPYGNMRCY